MAGINLEAVSYILDKFTTDEIIAYLEKGDYQVIDKSEHGDVLGRVNDLDRKLDQAIDFMGVKQRAFLLAEWSKNCGKK